jgi:anti-sigma28 factor (negative regulator of flagellin synthesis)
MNNTTLGLLVALAIITSSNQFGSFVEGMENGTPTTVGEDNVDTTGGQTVLTKGVVDDASKKRISDLKQDVANGTVGVDKEDIKAAIMSKDSKQIPVDPNMNNLNNEVSAASSGMLNSSNATLEGFSAYASV